MKKNTIAIPVLAASLLAGGLFMTPHAQAENANEAKQMQQQRKTHFTEAQRAEARKLIEASREKLSPVRADLFIKQQELKALQNATNPDISAVGRTAEAIVKLRQQMQSERQVLGLALDKALGLPAGTHAMKKYRFGKNGVAFKHDGMGHDGMGHDGMGRDRKHGRHMNRDKGHGQHRSHGQQDTMHSEM